MQHRHRLAALGRGQRHPGGRAPVGEHRGRQPVGEVDAEHRGAPGGRLVVARAAGQQVADEVGQPLALGAQLLLAAGDLERDHGRHLLERLGVVVGDRSLRQQEHTAVHRAPGDHRRREGTVGRFITERHTGRVEPGQPGAMGVLDHHGVSEQGRRPPHDAGQRCPLGEQPHQLAVDVGRRAGGGRKSG